MKTVSPYQSPVTDSFIYWLHYMANGILVLQPKTEPELPELEAQNLNH